MSIRLNSNSTQLNSNLFKSTVNNIVSNYQIDEIIETGSYHGDGSTKVFAETGKYVFSIECNATNYSISLENVKNYENVCLIHGFSLQKIELIDFILNEKFNIDAFYDSKYPKTTYLRELLQTPPLENCLSLLCNNERKQLILLDSAGGTGYLEFKKLMSFGKEIIKNKVLILDDIFHIKHVRSAEELKSSGYNIQIVENRFAWCALLKFKM